MTRGDALGQAIVDESRRFPLEGYRRLTSMMLDQDVVAVSPSSVYRVLKGAGLLDRNKWAPSKKGKGFVQPLKAHEHWHIDISYLNIAGTFSFLCSVLDGCSRAIVHWEIRETMKEPEVETIVPRALETYPGQIPRIISDNGPQFIAKDFKQFISLAGITHVRTSPYDPQSNGKLERWHGTLKNEEFRNRAPRDVEKARCVVGNFVTHYNEVRLHSALGSITPHDMLAGRDAEIFASRDAKLEAARASRLGATSCRRSIAHAGGACMTLTRAVQCD